MQNNQAHTHPTQPHNFLQAVLSCTSPSQVEHFNSPTFPLFNPNYVPSKQCPLLLACQLLVKRHCQNSVSGIEKNKAHLMCEKKEMKRPTALSSMTAAVLQFANSSPYELIFKYKQLTALVANMISFHLWKCLY